jgi:hypothetical protein
MTSLTVKNGGKKTYLLLGDRNKYSVLVHGAQLKARWNEKVKGGPGWIVPLEKGHELKKFITSTGGVWDSDISPDDVSTASQAPESSRSQNESVYETSREVDRDPSPRDEKTSQSTHDAVSAKDEPREPREPRESSPRDTDSANTSESKSRPSTSHSRSTSRGREEYDDGYYDHLDTRKGKAPQSSSKAPPPTPRKASKGRKNSKSQSPPKKAAPKKTAPKKAPKEEYSDDSHSSRSHSSRSSHGSQGSQVSQGSQYSRSSQGSQSSASSDDDIVSLSRKVKHLKKKVAQYEYYAPPPPPSRRGHHYPYHHEYEQDRNHDYGRAHRDVVHKHGGQTSRKSPKRSSRGNRRK